MGLLAKLKAEAQGDDVQPEQDNIGGRQLLESDAYDMTIKVAYLTASAKGANGLVLECEMEDGKDYKSTIWFTSGTAKGGLHYYVGKDGAKKPLPGFSNADAICLFGTGKKLFDQAEKKMVFELYDFETKKAAPTEVDGLPDLIGKKFKAGILKQKVNKQAKDNNGNYVDIAETKEENDLNKVFSTKGMTTVEVEAGITEPVFFNTWLDMNKGMVRDRTKPVQGNASAGAPPIPTGGAGSIFKK